MIRDQLIALILEGARKPEGLNTDEINHPRATKYKYTKILQDEGRLFKGRVNNECRYFDTSERATAWMAAYKRKPSIYSTPKRKVREGWGRDDPCHITSETIVTICPSPPQPTRSNTYPVF